MVENLSQQLNVSKDEISRLSGEVNNWKNQYNTAQEEVDRLISIVNASDAFEKESTAAISVYKERMEEAIRALQNTIEKYRVILGDERVSFESSSLKVLDDLKITQEKLLKVLPYFPLIRSFGYNPSKVVNDKIYDLSVILEVISPLNTLKEVEVKLIPVEYRYFITDYGMREEDYHKVFPKEEIKTIKLQPRGLEREMLDITFADLKGGREYLIKAVAKDVADSINFEERKTSYIRMFENVAGDEDIIADYYTWYGGPPNSASWIDNPKNRQRRHVYTPVLGEYSSDDPIVVVKHMDWATGHGIDVFAVSWWSTGYDEVTLRHYMTKNFDKFLQNPLISDIRFCILYENNGRFRTLNQDDDSYNWVQDFDDPFNRERLKEDFLFLTKYFAHPSYFKIDRKPYVRFDFTLPFRGDFEGAFNEMRKELRRRGYEVSLGNDLMHRSISPYEPIPFKPKDGNIFGESFFRRVVTTFDIISGSGPGPSSQNDLQMENLQLRRSLSEWKTYADRLGKKIIPVVWPGLEIAPILAPKDFIPIRRMPERLDNQVRISREYASIVEVAAFNEWGFGMQIEPSEEEGFIYLETLLKSLEN
jgi:predicted metal-dependent hydrolase